MSVVIFMGVDPGLLNTGIGLISWEGRKLKYLDHLLVQPPASAPLSERLGVISRAVYDTAKKYDIHSAAVEDVFHSVNAKSALLLGQARGAIIGALTLADVTVLSYTALQIKQAVVGYGRAEKEQVKKMVEMQLGRTFLKEKLDITDALACSICLALHQTSKIR